jgi:hypothetical protein
MSKLTEKLNKEAMTLVVELPEVSVKYAKAAQESGADAIIVRLDDSKDKSELISLVDSIKIPAGLYLDQRISATKAQLKAFQKLGFDFFIVPYGSLENWMLELPLGKIADLGSNYDVDNLTRISEKPIDALEAAVITDEDLDKELTVGDLQQYITIALSSVLPVIVPTQKKIRVSEIPVIWDTGAKAILLKGPMISCNITAFSAVIKEFKSAIQQIKDQ